MHSAQSKAIMALLHFTQVNHLSIHYNSISKEAVNKILKNEKINSLQVISNSYIDKYIEAVSESTSITQINFVSSYNIKGKYRIANLKQLSGNQNLNSIVLNTLDLKDDDILDVFNDMINLKKIDLTENYISEQGAINIAQNKSLQEVYLGSNDIGNRGAQALAGMQKLQVIDLEDNSITDEGIAYFAYTENLTKINIKSNGQTTDNGLKKLSANYNIECIEAANALYNGDDINTLLEVPNLETRQAIDKKSTVKNKSPNDKRLEQQRMMKATLQKARGTLPGNNREKTRLMGEDTHVHGSISDINIDRITDQRSFAMSVLGSSVASLGGGALVIVAALAGAGLLAIACNPIALGIVGGIIATVGLATLIYNAKTDDDHDSEIGSIFDTDDTHTDLDSVIEEVLSHGHRLSC